jgi:phage-related protein
VVSILKQCQKEIENFPEDIRGDLADLVARLDLGLMLSMPISRPMPSIGKGVHELRLKDRNGIYRVIYVLLGQGEVCLLHAFKKKTQATPQQNIELAQKRLREVL